jgi:hypothetical protein
MKIIPLHTDQQCDYILIITNSFILLFSSLYNMSSFPPDLTIYHTQEFLSHNLSVADGEISASLLLPLRADGTAADHFRIHVHGGKQLQAFFPLSIVINTPEAEGVHVFYQCTVADVAPSLHRTTTLFFDLLDAILNRTFILTDSDSCPIAAKELIDRLSTCSQEVSQVGASFRWAVTGSVDRRTELQLQALPAPLKLLKECYHDDNTAVVSVMTMPLPMLLGDGISYNGPIPTIFSPDPEATQAAILANPLRIKFQKAVGKILFMEYLTLPAAYEYVAKFRKAVGRPAFTNDVTPSGDNQNKRVRLMELPAGSVQDAGNNTYIYYSIAKKLVPVARLDQYMYIIQ